MTPYQAVIAAAELLEEYPESYNFFETRIPRHGGDKGCLLGWIGHFLNLNDLHLAAKSLGHQGSQDFYTKMIEISRLEDDFINDATAAAKLLRHFATEHLAAQAPHHHDHGQRWERPHLVGDLGMAIKVQLVLTVYYDEATTKLSQDRHVEELKTSIRAAVENGILTMHEEEALVDDWEIKEAESLSHLVTEKEN